MSIDAHRVYLKLAALTLKRIGPTPIFSDGSYTVERIWDYDKDDYFWAIRTNEGVIIDVGPTWVALKERYGFTFS